MNNNLDNFDNNLKDILGRFEPEYSPKAWSRLSSSMGHSYAKWYYVAASIVIVAVSIVTYNLLNDTPKTKAIFGNSLANNPENTVVTTTFVKDTDKIERSVLANQEETKKENVIKLEQEDKNEIIKEVLLSEGNSTKKIAVLTPDTLISKNNSSSQSKLEIQEPEIILSSNSGCEPLDVHFSIASLPKNAKVEWTCSERLLSEEENFNYTFNKKGKYTVKLNISTSTESFFVEEEIMVKETPVADFNYNEDDGLLLLENNSMNYESLLWSFPGVKTEEENPRLEMLYSGNYPVTLVVTNQQGCASSKNIVVDYKVNHHIFAPNAFSPNGDGINDIFLVKYEAKEGYSYTLQIFNSAGIRLFETQNSKIGWDGTSTNVNSSTNHEKYLWRLIITDPRGEKVIKEDYFEEL